MRLAIVSVITGVFSCACGLLPSAWAADEHDVTNEQIRDAIEAARAADPELAAEMERQFRELESGELDVRELHAEAPELMGRPIDIGTGGGDRTGDSLPPEAQAELERVFSQGTGDPSQDGHLREQAEQVMEKYGLERPAWDGEHGEGMEQRGEGFERAMMEHMAPEAREQMERFFEHEGAGERAGMEREFGQPEQERESMMREYESHEQDAREYETPEREMMEREFMGPERSTEAPEREVEAPERSYEAPERSSEMPEREMESGGMERDSLEGSGMGPH